NGGQLSYSYVAPLAAPSALLSLPSYLFDRNSPLRFHLRARPAQWAWVMHFLAACWPSVYRRHMAELSTLAYLSREMIGEMVACEAIDFDFGHRGKLVVHRDRRSLQAAADLVAFQRDLGADQSLIDAAACHRGDARQSRRRCFHAIGRCRRLPQVLRGARRVAARPLRCRTALSSQ